MIDPFVKFLNREGHTNVRILGDGNWISTCRFLFTTAIIKGRVGDLDGYDDRWCYHSIAAAAEALLTWDGKGEPQGWHRHPGSGRRRPGGDASREYINL